MGWPSVPVAGLPDKKQVDRDPPGDDQHPVLAFEAQKGEMLDKKLHRAHPIFGRVYGFQLEKYIIFIFSRESDAVASRRIVRDSD